MFPTISYKATNTELRIDLQNLLEQKFTSLEKFISENEEVVCDVEFEKETAHQSGKHFRVEANLRIDGVLYRAESTEESFEESIDEVRAELDKQLRRANKKKETLFKRGGRALKKLMQRG